MLVLHFRTLFWYAYFFGLLLYPELAKVCSFCSFHHEVGYVDIITSFKKDFKN